MKNKAYKYRIYPNTDQEKLIQKTFGCVRYVYNRFLEERITAYKETGKTPTRFQQDKQLSQLKKEIDWLREPDKYALQNALKDLDVAYKNFFRSVKQGSSIGFPKFKSKKNDRKSYSTANSNGNNIRIVGDAIHLPKLRYVKAEVSRSIPSNYRIINATISQEPSGKYFVSVGTVCEDEIIERDLDKRSSVGLDYSSSHFYVDSEGNIADMPHFFRETQIKLAREQRKLSRMVNGSNNYKKQKIKVARTYEKVRNSRMDWQHKESTRLAEKYDYICVEDINYKDMARSLNLAKATYDNGFGQFRKFLSYKMEERGKKLITIDKWFPSSKSCHMCGYVNTELKIGETEWDCPSCGAHLFRDHNAAINIRENGLKNAC